MMRNVTPERPPNNDAISAQHVWSVIRYLDPDLGLRKQRFALLFTVLVTMLIWALVLWIVRSL